MHVARHDAEATRVRVALVRGQTLSAWCPAHGIREALVGGFFTRPACEPLGELRTGGIQRASVPFDEPWGSRRACVHVQGATVRHRARDALPAAAARRPPPGRPAARPRRRARSTTARDDREGFSAGSSQFDSDITAARHPRAALALADGALLAVACDGRSRADAGLTLEEFAAVLVDLGAHSAINLDGGGSTSLVAGGRLRNRPYADSGIPEPRRPPGRDRAVFEPRLTPQEPERGSNP